MWIPVILLLIGFLFLIKGGDWFVDGATGIARRFRLPEILIGATIVSIGTTLPEIMVSAGAAFQGSGSIAYGNAIGSIICNTALISAFTIIVKPAPVTGKSLFVPVFFFFAAAALYFFSSYVAGGFSRAIGILLLLLFALYMFVNLSQMKKDAATEEEVILEEASGIGMTEAQLEERSGEDHVVETKSDGTKDSLFKDLFLLVFGAALIAFGADLLVDNAIRIAEHVGISEKVIGLTIVALGTSLPELVTAVTSLLKGHGSLSLGNIIGANLLNLVLVSGVAITINPFALPEADTIGGINASLVLDLPVMLVVMLILTVPTLLRKRLSRWQGVVLLSSYVSFMALQFVL